MSELSGAMTMTGRELRLTLRKPDALITGLIMPVMIMVVFVYLFGGAVSIGTKYVTYVVPGVLLLCAITGSAPTAISVCQDMTGGIIDRFRSMDVAGMAIVGSHVVASLVRNLVSTVLLFGVAFAMGFRPHATAAAFLGAVGVLALFVVAVSWLCAALGLLVSSAEAANSAMFLMFLAYPSSGFAPVSTMPWWLRGFAGNQPMTPIIETIRGLLLGQGAGSHLWLAIIWCCAILAVSAAASALLFRRRTA
jgi:ABC-2 type transport system permease protein